MVCSFLIFPLFKNLHLSGYETPQDKILYGIKENMCSYLKKIPFLILGLLVILCIYRDKTLKEKKNIYQKNKIYLNFYNILYVYFNAAYGIFQCFFDFLITCRFEKKLNKIFLIGKIWK